MTPTFVTSRRGYAMGAFKVPAKRDRSTHTSYLLDGIPMSMWRRVRARARREGKSMRFILLTLVEAWLATPENPT